MREILTDVTQNHGCTVLISSHILGELEKIATHYGIIRDGHMIKEMTAAQLDADCRTYTTLKAANQNAAKRLLQDKLSGVDTDESGAIRVYDRVYPEDITAYLYQNGVTVQEIRTAKIGLEEYYIDLIQKKGGRML